MQDKSKFTWGRKANETSHVKDVTDWTSEKAAVIKKIKDGDIDDDAFKKMKTLCMSIAKGRDSQNFSSFPPAEYKYFSELINLYKRYESKAITKADAESTEKKLLKEYQDFKEQETRWHQGIREWSEAIKVTEMNRSSIIKCNDKDIAFDLALQCLARMTGDTPLLKTAREKYLEGKPHAVSCDISPDFMEHRESSNSRQE